MISLCNKLYSEKIVVAEENKRKFIIYNNSNIHINKVIVDNCYIKGTRLKCDYLFEFLNSKRQLTHVIYLELKGKNIERAIKQLESTINYCESEHSGIEKRCYVILSKFPRSSTSSQKYKLDFRRKTGIQLYIDSSVKKITV